MYRVLYRYFGGTLQRETWEQVEDAQRIFDMHVKGGATDVFIEHAGRTIAQYVA